jgi:hypothetical protein
MVEPVIVWIRRYIKIPVLQDGEIVEMEWGISIILWILGFGEHGMLGYDLRNGALGT